MSPLDLSRLSGPDAVVALRSYPRRFRAAALPIEGDPVVEQWAGRIGPAGTSALDTIVATTNSWVLLGRALHQVLVQDQPVLHAAVVDPAERVWDLPPGLGVVDALDHLAEQADELADAVERIHPPDLERTGSIAGGGTITAFDLVADAVRVGAEGLTLVEQTIAAVRD